MLSIAESENAPSSIACRFESQTISKHLRLGHKEKAPSKICVTLCGMMMFSKLLFENELAQIILMND